MNLIGEKKREGRAYYYFKSLDQVDEYLKCERSVVYFVMKYLMITQQGKGKVPFRLYPFQIALLKAWQDNKYTIILKPRQMGISTLVCAYILWLAMFHPYQHINLISIKENLTRSLLRKIKFMYNNLPDFLKMEVINGTPAEIGTANRIAFKNYSEINALPATEQAGRSDTTSLLVMDEVAFQRYASAIWSAAEPSLNTGGRAILLSTAFGMGNFFHEEYVKAKQGVDGSLGMRPIKLDWRMHPDYTDEWYLGKLATLGKKRVAQEIDCDFLQSGFTVFDMDNIRVIEERLLQNYPLETREQGRMKIYHRYDPEHRYFLGADVASGRAHDFSSFSVMDEGGKEYACFKGKLGITDFGHLLMRTGNEYGQALLAPEHNGVGEGVIATIQENSYPNLYQQASKLVKPNEYDHNEIPAFGWKTTVGSRSRIITGMNDDLEADSVEMNNPFFVEEAYTFVYSFNNKAVALGKDKKESSDPYASEDELHKGVVYTDDAILGACITNEVRKEYYRTKVEMPIYGGR